MLDCKYLCRTQIRKEQMLVTSDIIKWWIIQQHKQSSAYSRQILWKKWNSWQLITIFGPRHPQIPLQSPESNWATRATCWNKFNVGKLFHLLNKMNKRTREPHIIYQTSQRCIITMLQLEDARITMTRSQHNFLTIKFCPSLSFPTIIEHTQTLLRHISLGVRETYTISRSIHFICMFGQLRIFTVFRLGNWIWIYKWKHVGMSSSSTLKLTIL